MSADPTATLAAAADTASEALGELRRVVPRLIARTRRQIDFAGAVVERFRCSATDGEAAPAGDSATDDADASGPPTEPEPEQAPAPIAIPDAPAAATLAIPDYDALAASQVLPRLVGLGPEELEDIRAYEAAHRGRRTILARLGQLQG